MRIAVIGAGVVGGYFGGKLARGGVDVVFIARGATLQALREHGLRVDSEEGNFAVPHPRATDDPATAGPVDVVLVAVKGWQAAGAIDTIRPLMGDDTFVVPVCDGIEVLDQYMAAFGKARVVGGFALMLGTMSVTGEIRNYTPDSSLTFGEFDGCHSERACCHSNAEGAESSNSPSDNDGGGDRAPHTRHAQSETVTLVA
jgi:2-dehydropantoate 2-reductase